MAAKRIPRGTRVDPVSLGYVVEKNVRDRFAQIAEHSGMSSAALFESMVNAMPLDERGFPTWLPSRPELKDGELPIDAP